MSNEMQISPAGELEIKSLNDVTRAAEVLAKGGDFTPAHFRQKPNAIALAILTGLELGISPMVSLRTMYVVNGKIGLSYDLMVALLLKGKYKIEWLHNDDKKATVKLTNPEGVSSTFTYTIEDASFAKLTSKDNWKHPKSMLRARAISGAVKAFAADVLCGAYSYDEIEEIKEKNITQNSVANSGNAALAAALDVQCEEIKEIEPVLTIIEDVDGVFTDSFINFSDLLNEAKTEFDLQKVSTMIKESNITDNEREILRRKYTERKSEI